MRSVTSQFWRSVAEHFDDVRGVDDFWAFLRTLRSAIFGAGGEFWPLGLVVVPTLPRAADQQEYARRCPPLASPAFVTRVIADGARHHGTLCRKEAGGRENVVLCATG